MTLTTSAFETAQKHTGSYSLYIQRGLSGNQRNHLTFVKMFFGDQALQ